MAIELSPSALNMLETASIAGRLVVLRNRLSPSAQECVDAGYLTEQPGIGLVVTPAGKDALRAAKVAK